MKRHPYSIKLSLSKDLNLSDNHYVVPWLCDMGKLQTNWLCVRCIGFIKPDHNIPGGANTFLMLNSLSPKFQLLRKTKIPTNVDVHALSLSIVVFIVIIYVKMSTIVGILTYMNRINFPLS